ncbi:hypothetical protein [Leptospira mtsangambouensis]|uniref:hypothetical protein n=1 Tax=Leptospira mtsangambouensis TaxID=2484912 RepID=UPI001EEC6A10|nr:hypothetical protein [Leptospira mtsangambouensis]MCG6142763.1 hypothetical protein [Leptospira mtsangambouensis]
MSSENFKIESINKWNRLLTTLFNDSIPESMIWTTESDILTVLNLISNCNNHMLLPNGGGMDLLSASKGLEPFTVELENGRKTIDLIKPVSLKFFKTIKKESCYFILETNGLVPSGILGQNRQGHNREELAEYAPLKYSNRSIIDQGYLKINENGEEIPLPEYTRIVIRYFEGKFLFVTKGSPFNSSPDAYDGIHNKISESKLYEGINSL